MICNILYVIDALYTWLNLLVSEFRLEENIFGMILFDIDIV